MTIGYVDFEFDLPGALLARLIEIFDELQSAPLSDKTIGLIPDAQGVYQLFHGSRLVYIGKTDADAGLRKRLYRHSQKVLHRANLEPDQISFKAVRVYVFTAIDLETQLISHYNGIHKVEWNFSGFGANDPGRNRDKTRFKEGHFDLAYPIDIDRKIEITIGENMTVAGILNAVKEHIPYVFRFESDGKSARKPHPDLLTTIKLEPFSDLTVRNVIKAVVRRLPPGWQATKLPSTLILYKENDHYEQGEVIART